MGGGGSKDNVGMTLSVAQINFDSPLTRLKDILRLLTFYVSTCEQPLSIFNTEFLLTMALTFSIFYGNLLYDSDSAK